MCFLDAQEAWTYLFRDYKHPTYPDHLKSEKELWVKVATADGIMSKAQELGIGADFGPKIKSYAEKEFKDVESNVPMVECRDQELPVDLNEE